MKTSHAYLAPDPVETIDLAVAQGAQVSEAADLRGMCLIALSTPAALTSTSAGIEASPDAGTTWLPLYDREGSAFALAVGASRHVLIPPGEVPGLGVIRLTLGTAEAAARTITLHVRKFG